METPQELRQRATRYRAMIGLITDQRVIDALNTLANEYDAIAARLEEDQTSDEIEGAQNVSADTDDT